MQEPIVFRKAKKILKIEDLKIGKYYYFYNELYQYCGNIEPFAQAYAFTTPVGTFYMNRACFDELVKNEGVYLCYLCRDS